MLRMHIDKATCDVKDLFNLISVRMKKSPRDEKIAKNAPIASDNVGDSRICAPSKEWISEGKKKKTVSMA